MPMYEYICKECGCRFERLVWSSDEETPNCDCGGEGERVISVTSAYGSTGDSTSGCTPSGGFS